MARFRTHTRWPTTRATRGFTLLEILLTIALIALLGGVLIGGSARLLSEQPVTVDEIFWRTVQQARKTALNSEREVRLKFDSEKKHFALIDGLAPAMVGADGLPIEETPLKTFPLPAEGQENLTVEFLGASAKGGNLILVGGVAIESQPISYVKFYSDGTCMPFRLQISSNEGARILSIDPWTCAPVLKPVDPNAPPAP